MPIPVETCHICQTAKQFKPHYVFDDCQIVRCAACGFMWLNPQPTEDDVKLVYNDTYFSNENFLSNDRNYLYGYVDYLLERVHKQVQYQGIVSRVKRMLVEQGQRPEGTQFRWLDIGCGLGYLLDCAYDYGFDVVGTELNTDAVKRLKMRYNFRAEQVPITDSLFDGECFDAISMTDVIEHLHDPRQVIARMNELTRPGGIAIITTMDSYSFTSRMLGKRLEDFRRTREHLYFFSRPTISRLLEEEGFEVLDIRSIGHTFELDFLTDRLRLISRPFGLVSQWMVRRLGLRRMHIYIDPHTKMIIYARRTG